jgi:hypothetical protein
MITEDDFGRFKELIDELLTSTEYQKSRDDLRNASWQNRGHSAEGIVDYLVAAEEELAKAAAENEEKKDEKKEEKEDKKEDGKESADEDSK